MSQVLPACWVTCPMPENRERTEQGELTLEQEQAVPLEVAVRRAHLEIVGTMQPARPPPVNRSMLAAAALGYAIGGPLAGLVAGAVAQRLAASEAAAPPSAPGQRAQRQGW